MKLPVGLLDEEKFLLFLFSDATDKHPVNVIVSSGRRAGYVGTTFLPSGSSVNNETVAGVSTCLVFFFSC